MRIIYIFSVALVIAGATYAQDYSDPVSEEEIVVEKPTDLLGSYRERRNRFGLLISVNYEKFSPSDYVSLIQNKTFDEMTGGDSIPLTGAELGVKYNMSLGSFAGLIGYATGNYTNPTNRIDKINASIKTVKLNFALDNLMSEPIVVPYGQIGASEIDWTEEGRNISSVAQVESFTTDWGLSYKVGLLFQLNWIENAIDPNTHTNGLRSSGLQNTFLDVFFTTYLEPNEIAEVAGATGDANLRSDNFGLGLKLEF